jgi:hypothetical protein
MIDRKLLLDRIDKEAILGKSLAGEETRNPKSISRDSSGVYNVNQFTYPEDLTQRADLQHYIVFYINIRGKSKFKPERTVNVDVSSVGQNRTQIGTQANQAQVGAAIGTGAAAGAAIDSASSSVSNAVPTSLRGKLTSKIASVASKVGTGASVAAGATAGAVAGATIAGIQQFSKTFSVKEPERISDAIMLPVESIPTVKYGMKYKTVDLGLLGGILGGSSAIESSLLGRSAEAAVGAVASIGNLSKVFGGAGTAVEAGKLAAKVATNPFREVMFESVDYRTFKFNYTFLPKSLKEVYNVQRIIELFKFHMHPELSESGLFYVYPSEFEMQYYFRGEQNTFLHKISTCVLTDMQVDYGKAFFSSFDDGAPTEIVMSLSFQEVELLTKERILKGY